MIGAAALLLSFAPAAAQIPPGATIERAVALDVTPDGFDTITDFASGLIPSQVSVPDVLVDGALCPIITMDGMWVGVQTNDLQILPAAGRLEIHAEMDVWVNSPGDPFDLTSYLAFCIPDSCDGHIPPFPVTVDTAIGLSVDPKTGLIVAQASPVNVDFQLNGNDIVLDGCFIGFIDDLLGAVGLSLSQIFVDQLDAILADTVEGLTGDIETMLNDVFAQLSIEEEFELDDGVYATLAFAPSDVNIDGDGLRLLFGGAMDTSPPATCIAPYDPGGSADTPGTAPAVGASGEHIALQVSDEFANQALYAVWRSGLLCQELGAAGSSLDIGLPLDTALLPLLFGEVYDPLFPDPVPITLTTLPEKPPTLDLSQPDGAGLALDSFALGIVTEIEGRQARLLDVALDVRAGANIAFDTQTGTLGVEIDLEGSPSAPVLTADVRLNEFAPGSDDAVGESLAGLLQNPLISGLISGLVGDSIGVTLPSICSFGVDDADLHPDINAPDWLSFTLWVGPVDYEGELGCSGGGGCGGCGGTPTGTGGCGTTPSGGGGCSIEEAVGCTTPGDTGGAGGCDDTCDPSGCDLGADPIEKDLCACQVSGPLQGRLFLALAALLAVYLRRRRTH